ncbi:MAG: hypothetical protein B6244_01425 [Candidatus Cloacimonetes bacterium 4572_55]|nr:MAG: hypothetical protein B6244_01425 [Candidatus Cloacimonetes bacterium 4572_55]
MFSFCPDCGEKLSFQSIKFCPFCGYQLPTLPVSFTPPTHEDVEVPKPPDPDPYPDYPPSIDPIFSKQEKVSDQTRDHEEPISEAPTQDVENMHDPETDSSVLFESESDPEEPDSTDQSSWEEEDNWIDLSKVPPISQNLDQESVRKGPRWESPEGIGRFRAFFSTLKAVLLSPSEFFQTMRLEGGLFQPLIFSIIVGWIGGLFFLIWDQALSLDYLKPPGDMGALQGDFQVYIQIISLILIPLTVSIALFFQSLLIHLFLLIFNSGKNGFEGTFRVIAYSNASSLFQIIPVVGPFIGGIYSLVLYVIGLRDAHEADGLKVTFAVLMPAILLCCCCAGMIWFFAMMAMMGSPELNELITP